MRAATAAGTLGLIALCTLASPVAVADQSGWYLGGNIGESEARIDDAKIRSGLLSGGFTTSSINDDDQHLGFKVFGGYKLNNYLALESGYFNLGKFGFRANTVPAGTLSGTSKIQGLNFDLLGSVPFTDKFSAFARIGAAYGEAKNNYSGTGAVNVLVPSSTRRAANYKFGVGLEYDFIPALAMRVEAERYRIDDAIGNLGDIDLFSIGLVFRFGGETAAYVPPPKALPEPVAAPVPEPVAPPPPPPPPPPPRPKRVSFSADSLFDFGKATVRPAGKQALDTFAADLRGTNFAVITVTGYTDRIGSHEYNLNLSTRRAEAVKAYLMESAAIPADKIAARGADGSDPKTAPGDCPGTRRTPQLIACLQPDRRVDIEVSGTK